MPRRQRDIRGFTVLDALITLGLAGILFGVIIPKYQRLAHEAQESAVRSELANIRTSIKLFQLMNGRNPGSLKEMMEKDVTLPARVGSSGYAGSVFKTKYLMAYAVDGAGDVLDAFGNRFAYDPKGGVVHATTKGYESW